MKERVYEEINNSMQIGGSVYEEANMRKILRSQEVKKMKVSEGNVLMGMQRRE